MFSKKVKETEQDLTGQNNHLAKGTKITGDIEAQGNIRIDCEVVGNIYSQAKVVLGASSVVRGNLESVTAEIQGQVIGNIMVSDSLVLTATSIVQGEVAAGKLEVKSGATIESLKLITNAKGSAAKKEAIVKDIKSSERKQA